MKRQVVAVFLALALWTPLVTATDLNQEGLSVDAPAGVGPPCGVSSKDPCEGKAGTSRFILTVGHVKNNCTISQASVVVDWADGTTETVKVTTHVWDKYTVTHYYQKADSYAITVTAKRTDCFGVEQTDVKSTFYATVEGTTDIVSSIMGSVNGAVESVMRFLGGILEALGL